jgi:hypothetical protein
MGSVRSLRLMVLSKAGEIGEAWCFFFLSLETRGPESLVDGVAPARVSGG